MNCCTLSDYNSPPPGQTINAKFSASSNNKKNQQQQQQEQQEKEEVEESEGGENNKIKGKKKNNKKKKKKFIQDQPSLQLYPRANNNNNNLIIDDNLSQFSSSQPEEFPFRSSNTTTNTTTNTSNTNTIIPTLTPIITQLPLQTYQPIQSSQSQSQPILLPQSILNLQRRNTNKSKRSLNTYSDQQQQLHSPFLQSQPSSFNNQLLPQRPEPIYPNPNSLNNMNYSNGNGNGGGTILSSSPGPYSIHNSSIKGRNRENSGSTYQPEIRSGLNQDSNSRISINGNTATITSGNDNDNEGKLSVGIDFGTTFSGVAYGSTRLYSGQIRQLLNWPGSYETYRKVPSCILYAQSSPNEEARIISWGLKAKSSPVLPGTIKCEWFKLFLSPESLRSGRPDERLPPLPYGKQPVDVICDFLGCLWRYAKEQITLEIGSVADLDSADVLLTVPSAWNAAGCAIMREAAIKAGLVQSSRGGDKNWRDRLKIITEPEAAAIHASTLSTLHNLKPSQTFVILDAGGGTCDTAVYRILGQLSQLEIAEVCVRSGDNCGSLFVDLKFEELLRRILKDHPTHLDQPSMDAFMHAFSETDKLAYRGDPDDDEGLFRFNCFNTLDSYDPSIGLEHGELAIPGSVLKREVFDPIIQQVLSLIQLQISKVPSLQIDAIILVGGFAASEYLFNRVQEEFGIAVGGRGIPVIARPMDCDVATLQGAARYGLGIREGKLAVSNVISPRGYIMKVKLPVEMIDRIQRPQFIIRNDAGMEVCTNRASYLIGRGAILKKGGKLRSRFCKYANGPNDSFFQAVLYVSDSDSIYRYTDEGEVTELCRWTVDLGALPTFQRIARLGGGYVEFDLGLELDSAEVRGVLMTDEGIECGRGTFDFI